VYVIVVKHILHNNGMHMYIAHDYDSTFFTTMACTCIKLKITNPHSLKQCHVHVYSSRLRLHILYNNGMYMYVAQDCKECGVLFLSYMHVHVIVVKNVES
jgi:hypothetical protein